MFLSDLKKVIEMKESVYLILFLIYYVLLAAVSVVFTIKDKSAAVKNKWRVSEKTLMLLGLFGGALPIYVTMKIIRHKTKHIKFMLGLPLEMFFHILVVGVAIYNIYII